MIPEEMLHALHLLNADCLIEHFHRTLAGDVHPLMKIPRIPRIAVVEGEAALAQDAFHLPAASSFLKIRHDGFLSWSHQIDCVFRATGDPENLSHCEPCASGSVLKYRKEAGGCVVIT